MLKQMAQTCIDCHKGIVHFLPEVHGDQNAQKSSAVQGGTLSDGSAIFATEMVKATNDKGMRFASCLMQN